MNPTDTQTERVAETFAERTPYLRKSREEAKAAWKDALEIGRESGTLPQIERSMTEKQLADLPVQDAWDQARAYEAYCEAPTEP